MACDLALQTATRLPFRPPANACI